MLQRVAPSSKENLYGFSLKITLLLLAAASAAEPSSETQGPAPRIIFFYPRKHRFPWPRGDPASLLLSELDPEQKDQ